MPRQRFVEKRVIGVDHLEQGTVALEKVDEEAHGLLVHRFA